ncbi:HEPN family nuclease [Methylobacterium sp. 22177]|uniref:HEPN family nuclease n=1 Tax=Methylobacterium sp. 22177 TaxID=3453885 RepID=UPI003F85E280
MGYPRGPLLKALAARILANLDHVEEHAPLSPAPQDDPPFADTQLLISLLGVIIFPHERSAEALGTLLSEYGRLDQILAIRHPKSARNGSLIELPGPDGQAERVDPNSIANLPRLLRHSIAHFNVLPLEQDGRFSGIRVWNVNEQDVITFVADIDFDAFRPLAKRVLTELADPSRDDLKLADPEDPLEVLRREVPKPKAKGKAPRPVDTAWNPLLEACGGDEEKARKEMTAALKQRAAELRSR